MKQPQKQKITEFFGHSKGMKTIQDILKLADGMTAADTYTKFQLKVAMRLAIGVVQKLETIESAPPVNGETYLIQIREKNGSIGWRTSQYIFDHAEGRGFFVGGYTVLGYRQIEFKEK